LWCEIFGVVDLKGVVGDLDLITESEIDAVRVGAFEGIAFDGDVFMDWGNKFSDPWREVEVLTTVDEGIIFDGEIVDGTRLEPSIGIVFAEDGRHTSAVEGVILDDDWFAGGEQDSTRGDLGNAATSHVH